MDFGDKIFTTQTCIGWGVGLGCVGLGRFVSLFLASRRVVMAAEDWTTPDYGQTRDNSTSDPACSVGLFFFSHQQRVENFFSGVSYSLVVLCGSFVRVSGNQK